MSIQIRAKIGRDTLALFVEGSTSEGQGRSVSSLAVAVLRLLTSASVKTKQSVRLTRW